MRIDSLQLKHFKNYDTLSVDLAGINQLILVGNNGQGKTNFLEAVMVLALSKPYRSTPLRDLISWYHTDQDDALPEYLSVRGSTKDSKGDHTLEVICERREKSHKVQKVDDQKLKPQEYVGHLLVVMFTPEDLNMIMLSPQLRRRYVNILISQIDREYLQHLSQYQVVLKQRNRLLERIREGVARTDELPYWDDALADHGAYLLWRRREVFRELNHTLASHYDSISSQKVTFQLRWEKEWNDQDYRSLRAHFAEYLQQRRARDIDVGRTCGGPHREDFTFQMNGRNLADSGSRGECRSAILSLKISECLLMKSTTGESPVLLLDDVFSELDPLRQRNLLQLFAVEQVIITTTHLDFTPDLGTVWKVEDGAVVS